MYNGRMNQEQEDELLMHVAAGTDLFTAMAALPREEVPPNESASTSDQWFSAIAWIVLAGVGFAVWLLLI
jgi:hypothetical protein